MKTKTELCEIFEAKDDEDFTRRFRRDISLCIGIGFCTTIGLLVAVINADKIDAFIGDILKMLFI